MQYDSMWTEGYASVCAAAALALEKASTLPDALGSSGTHKALANFMGGPWNLNDFSADSIT